MRKSKRARWTNLFESVRLQAALLCESNSSEDDVKCAYLAGQIVTTLYKAMPQHVSNRVRMMTRVSNAARKMKKGEGHVG